MELAAAIAALEHIAPASVVTLVTDSKYLLHGATCWIPLWRKRDWTTIAGRPVANQDLWVRLAKAMTTHTITWRWTRGHNGDPLNERADRLCQGRLRQEGRAVA
jgi:ribonuclease HI